jgi:hypothetical protein
MGKNSDHKNIFESYYNNVVLNEETIDLSKLDIQSLEALLKTQTNPDAKKSIEAAIDGKNSIPAGTMTADQAKEVIANQQSQNATPSQGTVVKSEEKPSQATDTTSTDAERKAKFDAMFPSREEYEKREGISTAPVATQSAPVATQSAPVAAPQPTTGSGEFDEIANLKAALNNPNLDPTLKKIVQDRITELSKQPQPQAQQAAQPAAKSSGGGSIVDYLASKGQPTDKASRAKLAAQEGIQNYSGTAEQNIQLLNKLKSREKSPTQQPATQQAQQTTTQPAQKQQGMGGAVGGVSKAIGSVGQGLKQATIGTKKPLGGVLGGISKAVGSTGKGIKKALVGDQDESEENSEDCVKCEKDNINNVMEQKINISKFLKHLSEKNYSSAHKYLKAIVDDKVKTKIAQRIAKI